MQVSSVYIELLPRNGNRLLAFASVTFDDVFSVHDIKIVRGHKGDFICMPSTKITSQCLNCRFPNAVLANYCNRCGATLTPPRRPAPDSNEEQLRLYKDIAHPVVNEFREYLQDIVLEEYQAALAEEGAVQRAEASV